MGLSWDYPNSSGASSHHSSPPHRGGGEGAGLQEPALAEDGWSHDVGDVDTAHLAGGSRRPVGGWGKDSESPS